jgi:phosphopantothenoylcysteine synthetase/decarboxylase
LALNPEAKLIIAPAMNGKMWSHPATQANVGLLRERGAQFIGPAEGELACGYEGLGRLETPDAIAEAALQLLGIPS